MNTFASDFTKEGFLAYRNYRDSELEKLRSTLSPNLSAVVFHYEGDPASKIYLRNKQKLALKFGIDLKIESFKSLDRFEFINKVRNCSDIPRMVQFPLPWPINVNEFDMDIYDIDGLSTGSIVAPCTPLGIMNHLKYVYASKHMSLEDKNIVIINRSDLVGNPLLKLAKEENMNVVQIHSKTSLQNKLRYLAIADVVVTATGKQSFGQLEAAVMNPYRNPIIYDVGIIRTKDGIYGDVSKDLYENKDLAISPVPGGVGLLTLREFIYNILYIHKYLEDWQRGLMQRS